MNPQGPNPHHVSGWPMFEAMIGERLGRWHHHHFFQPDAAAAKVYADRIASDLGATYEVYAVRELNQHETESVMRHGQSAPTLGIGRAGAAGYREDALRERDAALRDPCEPFCACGRRVSECDGSRRGCRKGVRS